MVSGDPETGGGVSPGRDRGIAEPGTTGSTFLTSVALIVAGLLLLYLGAGWLVRGSSALATRLGMPRFVVGLTVVALGTSAPELVVSVASALRDTPDLVLGNVLGSNLANIGLILGLSALIRPFPVHGAVVRRDLPLMLVVTVMLFPILGGSRIGVAEGVLLLLVFVGYMALLLLRDRPAVQTLEIEGMDAADPGRPPGLLREWLVLLGGVLGLILGAEVLVSGALDVARGLGVSELVIGLTVVAVGTSVPELATSVVAALRGESGIAVGNVVGSNIANLTLVLGASAAIRPLDVGPGIVSLELPVVLLLSALALPLAWTGLRLQRWEGGLLLGSYVAVTLWLAAA